MKKVRFGSEHVIFFEETEDVREYRKSNWMSVAMDSQRFRDRIRSCEEVISSVLIKKFQAMQIGSNKIRSPPPH